MFEHASSSHISVNINPDASGAETVNLYMAAVYNGLIFFRGATTGEWTQYASGSFPVAATVTLAGTAMSVPVVDFDISALPGLVLYVGCGTSEAQLFTPGHVHEIYTVPHVHEALPDPTPEPPPATTPDEHNH